MFQPLKFVKKEGGEAYLYNVFASTRLGQRLKIQGALLDKPRLLPSIGA